MIDIAQKKISKTNMMVDDEHLKEIIERECKYLSNVFNQTKQFRQSETSKEKEIEHHVQVTNRTGKIKTAKDIQDIQRAKTLEELYQRLDTYKNKRATKKGPNYERNLKRKIKKKSKLMKMKEETKKMKRKMLKEQKVEKRKEEMERKKEQEEFEKDIKPKINQINSQTVRSTEKVEAKGSIVFNKIDMDIPTETIEGKRKKDNPKVALEKLEKTNRLITKLKEKGNIEKADQIKERVVWSNVLNKAEGAKIKDDKEKIKKSIKKVEERKKKSEKKWKERIENTQKRIEMKQKKRKDNLKQRKQEKIKKKIKKSIKKGRTLPGVNDK